MATTVGTMAAYLTLNSSKFTTGMRGAGKSANRFAGGITRGIGSVARFGAALVGVAGIGGLAVMLKSTMANIDATAKLADVLGFTTEQLSAYQHVAAISGVSNEELATGLKRMEKNISDSEQGLTTAARAFDELGLSSADLIKLSPDEQFKAIADAMNTIPNQADKARVALDLFGRSGLGLLKVTELGAAGIRRLQQEAADLGLTFNRMDAAKVEAANDAVTRVKASVSGLVQQLTIGLVPVIESIADRMRGITGAVRDVTTQWDVFKAQGAVTMLGIAVSVSEFGDVFYNIFANIEEVVRVTFAKIGVVGINLFGPSVMVRVLTDFAEFFSRIFGNLQTIVSNLAENIVSFFSAAFEAIRTGSLEPFADLVFKSLTDGTKNLAAPVLDAVVALNKGVDSVDFNFKGLTEDSPVTAALKATVEQAQKNLEEAVLAGSQAAGVGTDAAGGVGTDAAGGTAGPQNAGALVKGTTAEYSARLAATGGRGGDKTAQDTEKNTDETASNTKELVALIRQYGLSQSQAVVVSI